MVTEVGQLTVSKVATVAAMSVVCNMLLQFHGRYTQIYVDVSLYIYIY